MLWLLAALASGSAVGFATASLLLGAGAAILTAFAWPYVFPERVGKDVVMVGAAELQAMEDAFAVTHPRYADSQCVLTRVIVPVGSKGPSLEAVFCYPKGRPNLPAIVLTHPWAMLGGDYNNNVPHRLSETLATCGFATLRFNFRGVGRSSGKCSWRGHAERRDTIAACQWLLRCHTELFLDRKAQTATEMPVITDILLVGYSYGSMISNSIIDELEAVKGAVSVSSPFPCYPCLSGFRSRYMLRAARQSSKPRLFIQGGADNFTGNASFAAYTSRKTGLQGPLRRMIAEGVDHMWSGAEDALANAVITWVRDTPELASVWKQALGGGTNQKVEAGAGAGEEGAGKGTGGQGGVGVGKGDGKSKGESRMQELDAMFAAAKGGGGGGGDAGKGKGKGKGKGNGKGKKGASGGGGGGASPGGGGAKDKGV